MSADKLEQLKNTMRATQEAARRTSSGEQAKEATPTSESTAQAEDPQQKLKEQNEALTQKWKEVQDNYVRLFADFENFRKRSAKEKEEALHYGYEKVARDLLPVLDGLEKALQHTTESSDPKLIVSGVELVLKQFLKVMEQLGVTPIEAVGEPFDPNHHEAMGHHESEEHEPDTVVQEYRRGYKLHNRLLRPALVTVAKPPVKG